MAALVCRDAPSVLVAPGEELVSLEKGTTVTDVIVLTAPLEKVCTKTSVDVEEESGAVVVVLDLSIVVESVVLEVVLEVVLAVVLSVVEATVGLVDFVEDVVVVVVTADVVEVVLVVVL